MHHEADRNSTNLCQLIFRHTIKKIKLKRVEQMNESRIKDVK